MKSFFLINKKEGATPLEALEEFRHKRGIHKNIPITYAGRLDPMASGLLIFLIGEECKNKEKYLNLSKEYEFEVLFGFSTDTYDILGKVNNYADILQSDKILVKQVKQNLKFFRGKFIQKYPIYSSKTVRGKPLFAYGREGVDIELPEREVLVKSLTFIGLKKITSKKLLENIERRVGKVKGDFRQEEIITTWRQELKGSKSSFYIGSFKVKCSSGTYVRGIAHSLGANIQIPALAFSIKRTKIGKYAKV